MEIYAASKREQSAPAKPKAGTGKRSAAATAADAIQKAQIEQAQMEKFQRTREALDIIEEQAREAEKIFTAACPSAEVTLLAGGQPVYYYMISAE